MCVCGCVCVLCVYCVVIFWSSGLVFSGTGTAQLLDQEKREVDMILGDVSGHVYMCATCVHSRVRDVSGHVYMCATCVHRDLHVLQKSNNCFAVCYLIHLKYCRNKVQYI